MSFIAFEGGEACGKSTQSALLAARLGAVLTREPGGTQLGERLRSLLLERASVGGGAVVPRAEALLMAAARAQHVAEVIRPALAAGRHVVTDRFTGSSLAYQGAGRGLGVAAVAAISRFATDGLEPDRTVLLVVPAAAVADRLARREQDRIEAAGDDFHARVDEAYRALAEADASWVVVDASGSVDEVAAAVWAAIGGVAVGSAGG
ncbi:MAG: dTMP kinase [Acidimicrobiia bacterium]